MGQDGSRCPCVQSPLDRLPILAPPGRASDTLREHETTRQAMASAPARLLAQAPAGPRLLKAVCLVVALAQALAGRQSPGQRSFTLSL